MENNTKEVSEKSDRKNNVKRRNYKRTYKNTERTKTENTSSKRTERKSKSFIDLGFEALEPKHLASEELKKEPRTTRRNYSRRSTRSKLDFSFKKSNLKIIALGGLDEIGKNITVFEYEDEIVLVDCGLEFPEDDMLGVDLVPP